MTNDMAIAAEDVSGQRAGHRAAIALGLTILAIGAIYWRDVEGAWHVWVGSTAYNHCFLIVPIAVYMGWSRRHALSRVSPRTEWKALFAVAALSLIWLAGAAVGVLELRQFAILTIIQGAALAILGWQVYRRLIAPFLYLYFLVPTGAFLVPALQTFTAQFAVRGLELIGIPVFATGTVIQIPAGTFAVAEACAGLRFLVAAVAFGVFYACEVYTGVRKRIIFIAICLILPIVANGLRAFGLIATAEYFGSATAVETDHILYGWLFFSIVLAGLVYIGHFFSDRDPFTAHAASGGTPAKMRSPTPGRYAAILVLCVAAAGLGPLLGLALEAESVTTLPILPPPVPAAWQPANSPLDWKPRIFGADRIFADSHQLDGHVVDRFVALYVPHGFSSNILHSENRIADPDFWRPVSRKRREVVIGGHSTDIDVSDVIAAGRHRIVWSFYVLDGTITTSVWEVKWHDIHAHLRGWKCPAAFFALSEEFPDQAGNSTALARFVGAMAPPNLYLCKH